MLDQILERLQHLEHNGITMSRESVTPVLSDSTARSVATSAVAATPVASRTSSDSISGSLNSRLDVTATLNDAIDAVQRLKLRDLDKAIISEAVNISPDLARKWIHGNLMPSLPFSLLILRSIC